MFNNSKFPSSKPPASTTPRPLPTPTRPTLNTIIGPDGPLLPRPLPTPPKAPVATRPRSAHFRNIQIQPGKPLKWAKVGKGDPGPGLQDHAKAIVGAGTNAGPIDPKMLAELLDSGKAGPLIGEQVNALSQAEAKAFEEYIAGGEFVSDLVHGLSMIPGRRSSARWWPSRGPGDGSGTSNGLQSRSAIPRRLGAAFDRSGDIHANTFGVLHAGPVLPSGRTVQGTSS